MDRRDFIKACATVGLVATLDPAVFQRSLASQGNLLKSYSKALLVKSDGTPLLESDITPEKSYIFFYPYASTPCFLINLNKEVKATEIKLKDGRSYTWTGGVGKSRSIVAYSAICAHQWSYPTKDYAFINYYPQEKPSETTKKAGVIQCCAHLAIYDPTQGAKPVDGPAEYPLAAVLITQEGNNLYATGVIGVDQFDKFFDLYKQELRKEYGSTAKAKTLVDKCVVMEVDSYVKNPIRC